MKRGGLVTRNYASALFDLGLRDGQLEAFGEALEEISRLLDEVAQLRLFLETPRVAREVKKQALETALGGRMSKSVLNFALLVIDRGRQRLLREMNREYQAMLDEHLGRMHVEVSVARQLDSSTLDRVTGKLSEILGRSVIPHVRVNPELLGGIVFRSGDVIFDGSVRRRLERLRRQLMAADMSTDQQVA